MNQSIDRYIFLSHSTQACISYYCCNTVKSDWFGFFLFQENASPETALMTLTAIDKDSGLNGKVVYRLLSVQSPHSQSELFKVDENTGVVSVNASLIGYPGSHNVTFGAFDSAAEPQNATTTVTVFVQDVNINTPVFVVPDEGLLNTTLGILPNITISEVSSFFFLFFLQACNKSLWTQKGLEFIAVEYVSPFSCTENNV